MYNQNTCPHEGDILRSCAVCGLDLEKEYPRNITITLKGGVVDVIRGLPKDWTWQLNDLDV